jgi:hypothetical protein
MEPYQVGRSYGWRTPALRNFALAKGPERAIVDVVMGLLRGQNGDGEDGTPVAMYREFRVEISDGLYSVRPVELAR